MTVDEIYEKALSKRFYEETELNKIIEYLKSCEDKITLKETGIEIEDVLKEIKEGIKVDLSVKCENNTITFPYGFKKFKEELIRNIPLSTKEMSLPISFLEDQKWLSRFSSLNKLTINDFGLFNEEELKKIQENTNIKNIGYKKTFFSLRGEYKDLVIVEKDSKTFGYYKDINLREVSDDESVERKEEIKVYAGDIGINDLEKIYDLIGEDLTKSNRKIIITCKNKKYAFNIIDGIVNMNIEDENMDVANSLYEFFESKGVKVNSIFLNLFINREKPIKYVDRDYEVLDKLNKKVEIRVRKDSLETLNWEDFRGLTEAMKWYRTIIKDYPLSPVEKLAFAYDILKTFKYNETQNNDSMESREPYKIIKTGHIVCAGYTAMLEEIFRELDDNIKIDNFGVTCYEDDDETVLGEHSRTIAIIDDKKYDIKGAYALDATWDSFKEEGKEKIDSDYTALDLYRYFMIPFSNYKKVFEHDSDIGFFKGELEYLNTNLTDENINSAIKKVETKEEGNLSFTRKEQIFSYQITGLLKDKSEREILEQFRAKPIPPNVMMQIIRNVRLAEGYTQEQIDTEMEKVTRIYDKTHPEINSLTGKIL